jgi:hypothetical protein|tara:strand:- start:62 stop:295 length:234 start_codon:yes stop_codon:yes gene_type:complete
LIHIKKKFPIIHTQIFLKLFGTINEEKEMTFKRKLMYTNKSPRRIDRKTGARNKKIIKPLYSSPCYLGEIEKQKKKK